MGGVQEHGTVQGGGVSSWRKELEGGGWHRPRRGNKPRAGREHGRGGEGRVVLILRKSAVGVAWLGGGRAKWRTPVGNNYKGILATIPEKSSAKSWRNSPAPAPPPSGGQSASSPRRPTGFIFDMEWALAFQLPQGWSPKPQLPAATHQALASAQVVPSTCSSPPQPSHV